MCTEAESVALNAGAAGVHGDVERFFLCEDVLDDVCRFGRDDAVTRYAWSRAAVDVTHELAGVGGNESDAVGSDVEENALHDDAVFVGADGKHGIVKTGNHLLGGDGEAHGLAGCLRG